MWLTVLVHISSQNRIKALESYSKIVLPFQMEFYDRLGLITEVTKPSKYNWDAKKSKVQSPNHPKSLIFYDQFCYVSIEISGEN